MDLLGIYARALDACSPSALVREAIARHPVTSEPVNIVAIGKCAAGLLEGAISHLRIDEAIAAIPQGYPLPAAPAEVLEGTHPYLTAKSFAAGERLRSFVGESKRPILFLVSGGSSACAESPLAPYFTEDDLASTNEHLLRSGLPIELMNVARKHLSAIKGGRLGALVRSSQTLIYSDVSRGNEMHVGSGPTVPDTTTNHDAARVLESIGSPLASRLRDPVVPETPFRLPDATWSLIADNSTLVRAAAEIARVQPLDEELNADVQSVAETLHRQLSSSDLLVAGGEPTVVVRGDGRGGRCSELALRFARLCIREPLGDVHALFASSDGLDGNSGAAGFVMHIDQSSKLDEGAFLASIARSDSFRLAATLGRPVLIPPTGNNLRDLFIVARNWQV